jgi:hypothetical protein
MTTSNTKLGVGATLTWNSKAVARIQRIGEFGIEPDKVDVTTFSATAYFKQFAAGMIDPGEVEIEAILGTDDTDGQVAFFTDCKSRTSKTAIITLPTTLGTVTFTGTAYGGFKISEMTPEGFIKVKIKLMYTGETTLSIAA